MLSMSLLLLLVQSCQAQDLYLLQTVHVHVHVNLHADEEVARNLYQDLWEWKFGPAAIHIDHLFLYIFTQEPQTWSSTHGGMEWNYSPLPTTWLHPQQQQTEADSWPPLLFQPRGDGEQRDNATLITLRHGARLPSSAGLLSWAADSQILLSLHIPLEREFLVSRQTYTVPEWSGMCQLGAPQLPCTPENIAWCEQDSFVVVPEFEAFNGDEYVVYYYNYEPVESRTFVKVPAARDSSFSIRALSNLLQTHRERANALVPIVWVEAQFWKWDRYVLREQADDEDDVTLLVDCVEARKQQQEVRLETTRSDRQRHMEASDEIKMHMVIDWRVFWKQPNRWAWLLFGAAILWALSLQTHRLVNKMRTEEKGQTVIV